MIRKTLILLCVCAASAFLSCAKAPEPAKLLYVMAEVTCASGNGTALVTVKKGSSSGETVSGAAVTINSQPLDWSGSAYYSGTLTGLNSGTQATLSIISSEGNITSISTVPAAGGNIVGIPVANAASGSQFIITNN